MASFFDNKARAAAVKTASSSKSAPPPTDPRDPQLQPWVEKYRPKTLSDITSQSHTTNLLTRTLHTPNLPHLLFHGPPGTGKTSTILALSRQLFGPELHRSRVLELNASDERGINVVRTKIKDFARQQLTPPPAGPAGVEYRKRHPCPPYKIVVLDEADSMTQDAQSALRRTMEAYSRITRFCLICNYVTRIIDPLASRCSKFRFKSLDGGDAVARVSGIAEAEGVELEESVAEGLVRCAEGDLRRAITFLQSAARLVGAMGEVGSGSMGRGRKRKGKVVEEEDGGGDAMDVDVEEAEKKKRKKGAPVTMKIVEEIAGVIPPNVIDALAAAILPGTKKNTAAKFDSIKRQITLLVLDGWSAAQLTGQLYQKLIYDETVQDKVKVRMLAAFGEADKRLVDGADEELTVLDLAVRCAGCFEEGKG